MAPADELDLGGGGVQAPPITDTAPPPATPPTKVETPAVPPQQVLQLSPEQLKEIVGSRQQQQQAPPQPPPMTEAERNKLLRRFMVDDKYASALFDVNATPQARAAALQQMVDGTAEHAFHVAQLKFEKELKALREEYERDFTPVREHFTRQESEQAAKSFYAEYPQLEQYQQIVQMVAGNVKPEHIQGKTPLEVKKLIAEGTMAALKSLNISLDASSGGQPAQPTTPAVPRSQPLNGGGRSQGAPAPAAGKAPDPASWLDKHI